MAKIETTAFDSADYLNTAEAIAAYLDAYLEIRRPKSCAMRLRPSRARTAFRTWRGAAASAARDLQGARPGREPVVRDDPLDPGRDGLRLTVEPAEAAKRSLSFR